MSVTETRLEPRIRVNGGLGDVPGRLRRKPLKIAYLGASITAQRRGWRPQLHEMLCRETGREHQSISACVGAIGSVSGAFLAEELVVPHEPDLCFVEFTAGDYPGGHTPLRDVEPAIDGILRKLREVGCRPVLVHLPNRVDRPFEPGLDLYDVYARVAERHGAPWVDIAGPLGALVRDGALTGEAVFKDELHLTPEGGALVAEAIQRGLGEIAAVPSAERAEPPPPDERSFHRAKVVPARPDMLADPASATPGRFRFFYDFVEGGPFHVELEGELVGFMLVAGPEARRLRVDCDGESQEVDLVDEWSHSVRLAMAMLDRRCRAGARVAVEPIDGKLQLIGFLVRP
jgi:lysophospholipase L1-like esterase